MALTDPMSTAVPGRNVESSVPSGFKRATFALGTPPTDSKEPPNQELSVRLCNNDVDRPKLGELGIKGQIKRPGLGRECVRGVEIQCQASPEQSQGEAENKREWLHNDPSLIPENTTVNKVNLFPTGPRRGQKKCGGWARYGTNLATADGLRGRT